MKKHITATSSDETTSTSFIGVFLNDKVTELDYVYRGTVSDPSSKFIDGFIAKGNNTNLTEHIQFWSCDSNFVSTSLSKDATLSFIKKPGFIYEINPPGNGIKAENLLVDSLTDNTIEPHKFKEFIQQREICIRDHILPHDIKGAWPVTVTQLDARNEKGLKREYIVSDEFIQNPGYRPSTAVRLAQGAKALGHAVTAVGAGFDGYNLYQTYNTSQKNGNYQEFFKEGARIIARWRMVPAQ